MALSLSPVIFNYKNNCVLRHHVTSLPSLSSTGEHVLKLPYYCVPHSRPDTPPTPTLPQLSPSIIHTPLINSHSTDTLLAGSSRERHEGVCGPRKVLHPHLWPVTAAHFVPSAPCALPSSSQFFSSNTRQKTRRKPPPELFHDLLRTLKVLLQRYFFTYLNI